MFHVNSSEIHPDWLPVYINGAVDRFLLIVIWLHTRDGDSSLPRTFTDLRLDSKT